MTEIFTEENLEGQNNQKIDEAAENSSQKAFAQGRFALFLGLPILVVILTLLVFHLNFNITTSDAFVTGHILDIKSAIGGQVVKVNVLENQEVKLKDVLVELESADLQTKLEKAESALKLAKSKQESLKSQVDRLSSSFDLTLNELNTAVSKLNSAELEYTKHAEMYKEGIVSTEEYDESLNILILAQAAQKTAYENNNAALVNLQSVRVKLKANEAEIKDLDSKVNQIKGDLKNRNILAPADGLITEIKVKEGSSVDTENPLLYLVPKNVWVLADFDRKYVEYLNENRDVTIKIDGYPHKKFKGHIESGIYIADKVRVKIVLDEDMSEYNFVPEIPAKVYVKRK